LIKEISLTVVAALLTLVGYSMNDTIVIFDRIRENLKSGLRRENLEIGHEHQHQPDVQPDGADHGLDLSYGAGLAAVRRSGAVRVRPGLNCGNYVGRIRLSLLPVRLCCSGTTTWIRANAGRGSGGAAGKEAIRKRREAAIELAGKIHFGSGFRLGPAAGGTQAQAQVSGGSGAPDLERVWRMFEQTFVEDTRKTKRPWTVALSFLIQLTWSALQCSFR
jgi:hypothetical protein